LGHVATCNHINDSKTLWYGIFFIFFSLSLVAGELSEKRVSSDGNGIEASM